MTFQGLATAPERCGESISQAWRDLESTAAGTGARIPEGAALSRERSRPRSGQDPVEQSSSPGQPVAVAKLRRGTAARAVGRVEGEFPRGQKTRRAAAFRGQFTLSRKVANPHREQSLEGSVPARSSLAQGAVGCGVKARKAAGFERGRRLCEGERPWRWNPTSVAGMKHCRKVAGDVSRQEGPNPGDGRWRVRQARVNRAPGTQDAVGDQTPGELVADLFGSGRVWLNSEGESKLRGG
jgi:hypothetical protein